VNLFHLALLTEGVLTIPGSNDFFLSFAHTESDVAAIVDAARRVLGRFDFATVLA
jgi:glutamate-1-semialdehyde aminotransferase